MSRERAVADPMMTAPDVCLYCGVLLARDAGGVRHRSESPCRDPRPCEDRERELRWDDWLTDPPWARPPARGGAPHIVRYGTPGVAVCGALTGVPQHGGRAHGCVACRTSWAHLGYAWQYERHWGRPYGGSGIVALAEALGLWDGQ